MGAGKFLGKTVDVVEVAVRLVLVFLVQLILVEALVVKFCRLRYRRYPDMSMLSGGCCFGGVREGKPGLALSMSIACASLGVEVCS